MNTLLLVANDPGRFIRREQLQGSVVQVWSGKKFEIGNIVTGGEFLGIDGTKIEVSFLGESPHIFDILEVDKIYLYVRK